MPIAKTGTNRYDYVICMRCTHKIRTGNTVSYGYDMNGVRDSKTVNGVEHKYYYASGKLLRETYGTNTLDFIYDSNGNPYALEYNGNTYYYITNLQGDVMYMVDANGATVATYEYDPYGKIINSYGAMAEINPLRYRGYYYDAETGFYYLQSRYYDPTICRFINADGITTTGQGFIGYNMFAYCGNNPANRQDASGNAWNGTNTVAVCDGGAEYAGRGWIHDTIMFVETAAEIRIYAYLDVTGPLARSVVDGIKRYWNGSYDVNGSSKELSVMVILGKSKYNKSIPFITSAGDGASNTSGCTYMNRVPAVNIYLFRDGAYQNPEWTSAHEFGHCLGIEDYYTHSKHPAYKNQRSGIMDDFGAVPTCYDIVKMLEAFYTREYQYWEEFL